MPRRCEVIVRLARLALPYRGWMALGVLLGFLTVGSAMGLMMTSAYIIAHAALHPSVAELQVAIVGVRFFGLARGVLRYLERLVSHEAALRVLADLRVWFYQRLEPLAPARLWSHPSADLLTRLVADVESLEGFYIRALRPPLVAAAVTALAGLLLGAIDRRVALAAVLLLVGAGLFIPWATTALRRRLGGRLVACRAELQVRLLDQVQGLADLLAWGRADDHLDGIETCSRELVRLQRRLGWLAALHEALVGLAASAAAAVALALAIPAVRAGELDGVLLPVVVLGILAAFEAVLPLTDAAVQLDESAAAARRLFEVADAEPAVMDEIARPEPLPVMLPAGPPAVHFQQVGFGYDAGTPVLDGVDLEVPAGARVAVVGASGAGKSTLLHLLLRFWDCDRGRILVGGADATSLPLDQLRRCFGVVPQRTHLFAGTVRDNLLLARPGAAPAQLEAACRSACLHDFIVSLPRGYDTDLGDRGFQLSGGERQRLAVARALLSQAPVLLLDEATAHLDTVTEAQVMGEILDLAGSRSVLVVTHRFAGLGRMDRIYVLEGGRMVESGRHADLVQRPGGRYRRLWDLHRGAAAVEAVAAVGQ